MSLAVDIGHWHDPDTQVKPAVVLHWYEYEQVTFWFLTGTKVFF